MKKIILTFLSVVLLINFVTVNVKADDEVILSLDNTKDTAPFTMDNMMPGETETKTYNVTIYHKEAVTMYFDVNVTNESYNLGDYLFLTITDGNGYVAVDNKCIKDIEELEVYVDKGVESITFEITTHFDDDYAQSEDYQNLGQDDIAYLTADFEWYVKEDKEMYNPPITGVDSITNTLNNISFDIVTIVIIGCLLVVIFFLLKERTFKNKIIKGVVLVFTAFLIFANTTYALYLVRLKIEDNFFSTKKYDISIDLTNKDDEHEPIASMNINDYFEPGRSRKYKFNIKNTGSMDVYYRLYISVNESEDEKNILMNSMKVAIYSDEACTDKLFEVDGNKFVKENCFDNNLDILETNDTKTFYMLLTMDEDAGNEYQGTYSDFTIICDAVQSTNNDGGFIDD